MAGGKSIALLVVAVVLAFVGLGRGPFAPDEPIRESVVSGIGEIDAARLPPEARDVLRLIRQDGPFPYSKDGSVFGNREGLLPQQPPGYYAEYTVPTPGARDRGARRIVAGGRPRGMGDNYYTDDHYRSFRRIRE
ncbi:MAG: ribonuclease [Burkholderiaceae bacterium]|jgi:ribonuclease T1|nr:ribonuclease [Burkholderiaceae bacterium]MEB2318880.1 ribonuclease [Pseudomonadota bacterium]